MSDFNTSLLREKFIIKNSLSQDEEENVYALSNRIIVPPIMKKGIIAEPYIVRSQNMHTTTRFAARIVQSLQENEVIMQNWAEMWYAVIEGYEKKYNPKAWAAIYYEGQCIFEIGEHHPFLDIIEKLDYNQKDDYERSVKMAEKAFQSAGKSVEIEYHTNVAMVLSVKANSARCGVILRGAAHTATFNFTAKKNRDKELRVSQCLSVAAAYLEGIQLAFELGVLKRKLHYKMIDEAENKKLIRDSEDRLTRLDVAIAQFDQAHDVAYRPERPLLTGYVEEAEKYMNKILRNRPPPTS